LFGVPVHQFTLNGKTTIKTRPGLCFTFLILIAMFYFALSKMPYLLDRKNPLISTYKDIEHFDSTTHVNLDDTSFRIAFGVEGYDSREGKDDPYYVEWQVRATTLKEDGTFEKTPLNFHKCADRDWE